MCKGIKACFKLREYKETSFKYLIIATYKVEMLVTMNWLSVPERYHPLLKYFYKGN